MAAGWLLLPPGVSARLLRGCGAGGIAWDGRGNTSWRSEDVTTLCGGAEQSLEPSHCFRAVISGRIEWGDGMRWNPRNALNLRRGSRDAQSKPLTVIESR